MIWETAHIGSDVVYLNSVLSSELVSALIQPTVCKAVSPGLETVQSSWQLLPRPRIYIMSMVKDKRSNNCERAINRRHTVDMEDLRRGKRKTWHTSIVRIMSLSTSNGFQVLSSTTRADPPACQPCCIHSGYYQLPWCIIYKTTHPSTRKPTHVRWAVKPQPSWYPICSWSATVIAAVTDISRPGSSTAGFWRNKPVRHAASWLVHP